MGNKNTLILVLISTIILSGCSFSNVTEKTFKNNIESNEETIKEIEERTIEKTEIETNLSKNEEKNNNKEEFIIEGGYNKRLGSFIYIVPEGYKENIINEKKALYYNEETKCDWTVESLPYEKNQIIDYNKYLEQIENAFVENSIKFERKDDDLDINNVSYIMSAYNIIEDTSFNTKGIFYLFCDDKTNNILNIIMFEFLNDANIENAKNDFYNVLNNIYLNENIVDIEKKDKIKNKKEDDEYFKFYEKKNGKEVLDKKQDENTLEIYDGNYQITLRNLPSNFKNYTQENDRFFYISNEDMDVFCRVSHIENFKETEKFNKEFYSDTSKFNDFNSEIYEINLNNKDYEFYKYSFYSIESDCIYWKYKVQSKIDKEKSISISLDSYTSVENKEIDEKQIKEIIKLFDAKYVG